MSLQLNSTTECLQLYLGCNTKEIVLQKANSPIKVPYVVPGDLQSCYFQKHLTSEGILQWFYNTEMNTVNWQTSS